MRALSTCQCISKTLTARMWVFLGAQKLSGGGAGSLRSLRTVFVRPSFPHHRTAVHSLLVQVSSKCMYSLLVPPAGTPSKHRLDVISPPLPPMCALTPKAVSAIPKIFLPLFFSYRQYAVSYHTPAPADSGAFHNRGSTNHCLPCVVNDAAEAGQVLCH